jgi:membrane protease YdiL (CAAX protease family)
MSDGKGTGRIAVGLAIWLLFVLVSWNLHVVGATGAPASIYASLVLGLICCLLPWLHATITGRRAPLLRAWHDPGVRLDAASFTAIAIAAISLAMLVPAMLWQCIQLRLHSITAWLTGIRQSLTVDMPGLTGPGALLLSFVVSAVANEVIYRGYLQRYVFADLRRPWAVLLTALLYAIGNGGTLDLPVLLLVGVVLGIAVEITGRVWVGVLLHATLNLVHTLMVEAVDVQGLLCPWAWLALPALVGALYYLYRHLRRQGRVPSEGATP